MRYEHGCRAQALAPLVAEKIPEIAQAHAAGEGDGVDAPVAPCFHETGDSTARLRAPIALDEVDAGATVRERVRKQLASAVAAEDGDALAANVRQGLEREQPLAV